MANDDLRQRLRADERSLVEKYGARIDVVERLRPGFIVLGVIGASIAALSRLVADTPGSLMAIGGAGLAVVGGAVAGILDFRKLELGCEAKDAYALADEAITQADAAQAHLSAVEARAAMLDRMRRERLLAIEQMIEAAEAGLLIKADAASTAHRLLRRSISSIRKAIDYDSKDFLTISIFRKQIEPDGVERMIRIATQWTDPERASGGGRNWALGKGYTGVAWRNAMTNPRGYVVIPDTGLPHVRTEYPVDDGDPEREKLYRSVAAIPILIGGTNNVWGVVTATTDRTHVFGHDTATLAVQSIDMIRDIARIAALLSGLPDSIGAVSVGAASVADGESAGEDLATRI